MAITNACECGSAIEEVRPGYFVCRACGLIEEQSEFGQPYLPQKIHEQLCVAGTQSKRMWTPQNLRQSLHIYTSYVQHIAQHDKSALEFHVRRAFDWITCLFPTVSLTIIEAFLAHDCQASERAIWARRPILRHFQEYCKERKYVLPKLPRAPKAERHRGTKKTSHIDVAVYYTPAEYLWELRRGIKEFGLEKYQTQLERNLNTRDRTPAKNAASAIYRCLIQTRARYGWQVRVCRFYNVKVGIICDQHRHRNARSLKLPL